MAGPWDNLDPTGFETEQTTFVPYKGISLPFWYALWLNAGYLVVLAMVITPWFLTVPLLAKLALLIVLVPTGIWATINTLVALYVLVRPSLRRTVIGF